jgi:hypothetical protein
MQGDNYYDDSESAPADSPGPSPDERTDTDTQTFLMPKDVFGEGVKVGDTCKVQVVAIHEDEVEAKYLGTDDGSEGDQSSSEESDQQGDPEMQSLMS